jgi:hypothetical protein
VERGVVKASEIFLDFVSPISEVVPATGNVIKLQKLLRVPELVWNAVVLERNTKRKVGRLPKVFEDQFVKLSAEDRAMTEAMLGFWVDRKDRLFSEHDWPIEVTVYKNVKEELIVQARVPTPKNFTPNLPKEWQKPKLPADIVNINKR